MLRRIATHCKYIAASVMALGLWAGSLQAAERQRVSFNEDWRFIQGDSPDQKANLRLLSPRTGGRGAQPAAPQVNSELWQYILPAGNDFIKDPEKKHENPATAFETDGVPYAQRAFDDKNWRLLDLPHDFGVEGDFLPPGTPGSNGEMGRLPGHGQGWYRKHLNLPAADAGKEIFLDIDGAMSFAIMFVNGKLAGGWPYGYASWRVDLTPYVKPGEDNVIAIRVDNPPESSRWYTGVGIYRNVWLTRTSPVHVGQWGTFITTPQVSADLAAVNLKVTLDNKSGRDADVSVSTEIFTIDTNGKRQASAAKIAAVSVNIKANASSTVETQSTIANPRLWSIKNPARYLAYTTVTQNGAVVDTYETPFGVRTLKFDPDKGFFINGEHVMMNGVCNHHDLGALGAAVNVRAMERQLEILRDMGCNAIRTSHNPPAPELLDLADKMGFLIFDEAFDVWGTNKVPNDYGGRNLFNTWHEQDLRMMIRRDRNHPSVVLWSIGNEIPEQNQGANSRMAKELIEIVHSEDTTRPATSGCNDAAAMNNGFNTLLDVMGLNYKSNEYVRYHQKFPNQFFFASETASQVSSRGEYVMPDDPKEKSSPKNANEMNAIYQISSYDLFNHSQPTLPDNEKEFFGQDQTQSSGGEFVWTGFDYLGEPYPWRFMGSNAPPRSSYFGIVDLAGFPKDRYYSYQARWRPDFPMARIFPHWNWPDRVGKVTPVHVYTSGDEAELFVNGKSQGRKKKIFETPGQPQDGKPAYRIRWDSVVYEPGELKVVAYKNGAQWATDIVKTTLDASKLTLKPDRAEIASDGQDLSFVTVTVADKEGLMVPRSKNTLTFEITGPGEIVATDNGDATDLVSFKSLERKAFNGLALVIVKAKKGQTGEITVFAKSQGLATGTVTIHSK